MHNWCLNKEWCYFYILYPALCILAAIYVANEMMPCVVFDLQTINKLEDLLDGIGVN